MKPKIIAFFLVFIACGNYLNAEELRIVSLAPSVTEILFAINAGSMVRGVSSYCNYPEEVKDVKKVGSFSNANIEKIASLKPDIVFTAGIEQAMISNKLKMAGIKTVSVQPANVSELFLSIMDIAKKVNRQNEGSALCSRLRKEMEAVQCAIPMDAEAPRVMLEIWGNPLMVAGVHSFAGDLLRIAGGKNIAYDTPRPYCRFSPELAVKRNPHVIILGLMQHDGPMLVYSRSGWSEVSAVKNKRVYNDIDPDLILRPGPRFVMGIREIQKRLYEKK